MSCFPFRVRNRMYLLINKRKMIRLNAKRSIHWLLHSQKGNINMCFKAVLLSLHCLLKGLWLLLTKLELLFTKVIYHCSPTSCHAFFTMPEVLCIFVSKGEKSGESSPYISVTINLGYQYPEELIISSLRKC